MKTYTYQNTLIGKKQLRQLLAWSFTNYDSMQACLLADELKYLGFKYASQAGISISIEDLRIPFVKSLMIEKANDEIYNSEKIFLKGKITNVERFQKIIDTWSLTSESLKNQIIYYFKNYDPLNSVYIMAFSGARGNLSQVRQLVGMRGLMSDPSGQIMNLPIKRNFREGLTITDYLMSGYGARKGIVDTALKTANSGYLTRRLIDVSQDIIIREKDCLTNYSFLFSNKNFLDSQNIYNKILGRVLNKSIINYQTGHIITQQGTSITPELIEKFKEKNINDFLIRSPLTCQLYRAICQKCYGWDLSTENLVDIGEAIGILAGQSIGEPGTQLTMRTFHTGGIFTSEARKQIINPINGVIQFYRDLKTVELRTTRGEDVFVTKNSGSVVIIPKTETEDLIKIPISRNTILFPKNNQYICKDRVIGEIINTKKQVKAEIKPILSDTCGEIFIPKLKQKNNVLNTNQLIWILSGQLYSSPPDSFLNFYPDYKLNQFSYIFRTKLITHYNGITKFVNNKESLNQGFVKFLNHRSSLTNSKLEKLNSLNYLNKFVLTLNKSKYFVTIEKLYAQNYLQITRNERIGSLITNAFRTHTGGTSFYLFSNRLASNKIKFLFLPPFYLYKKFGLVYLFKLIKKAEKRLEDSVVEQEKKIGKMEIKITKIDRKIRRVKSEKKKSLLKRDRFLLKEKIRNGKKGIDRIKYYQEKVLNINLKNVKILDDLPKEKRITFLKLVKWLADKRIIFEEWLPGLPQVHSLEWPVEQKKMQFDQEYFKDVVRNLNFRSIIWLSEEMHPIKDEASKLLVKDGDFISKGFEFLDKHIAKTSGYITISTIVNKKSKTEKKIQLVSIKSGLIYKNQKQHKVEKKLYYPGEMVFSNVSISTLSFCESFEQKNNNSILIRPLQIYEVPYCIPHSTQLIKNNFSQSDFSFVSSFVYRYKSEHQIFGKKSINLVDSSLFFKTNNFFKKNTHITLLNNTDKNSVDFYFIEKLYLNNYVPAQLRNKNIQPCFLVQNNQFVSTYNILGYLESLTSHSLEIVKFKIKQENVKQIFLISNNDCIAVKKSEIPNKKINDFIVSKSHFTKTGKIIIDNKTFFTIQKGRPYFFPNCKTNSLNARTNLQYKIIPQFLSKKPNQITQNIRLNYYDYFSPKKLTHISIKDPSLRIKTTTKKPKFYVKKVGKLYSCNLPYFLPFPEHDDFTIKKSPNMLLGKDFYSNFLTLRKKYKPLADYISMNPNRFAIKVELFNKYGIFEAPKKKDEFDDPDKFLRNTYWLNTLNRIVYLNLLDPLVFRKSSIEKSENEGYIRKIKKLEFNQLIKVTSPNSELISNNQRKSNLFSGSKQLAIVKIIENLEYLGVNNEKTFTLNSITENYFEQKVNYVFCKNHEFIEEGKTIGLLNLEKEITGDIVQGLPRIEEILEARKKYLTIKRIPLSQKKSLLTQKTSLDINFDFQKVGTPIKENERINPHKLVKSLFNYYGLLKIFFCERTNSTKFARLTNNYEASYRSFKKVQVFMLDSIQSVYESQGVAINDKHLEIVIRQMTTKIVITAEGNSPLLIGESIDLYHVYYINKILMTENKKLAYYVPLLLGITKAALNNPSFISAASFQETTRVLTKAAIEGRIDWLRGLKENIIVGHLIPVGTGSINYRNCFKKYSLSSQVSPVNLSQLSQNPRQMG